MYPLLAGILFFSLIDIRHMQIILNGTTVLEAPFIYSESGPYRGYCVDVMDAISKQLRFNYTLHQSPDGKIGSVTRLNGVFGELTGGNSEFAIGGISRNWLNDEARAYAMGVLFTRPILVSTLNVLLSKNLMERLEKLKLEQTNDTDWDGLVKIEDIFNFSHLTRLVFKDSAVQEFYAKNNLEYLPYLTIVEKSALFGYGLDRLYNQDYVLIDETKFNDFYADQQCYFTLIDAKSRVDDGMTNVQFDAATPAGSRMEETFRNEIVIALSKNFVRDQQKRYGKDWLGEFNSAIERLEISGKLMELQNKHWRSECRKNANKATTTTTTITQITLSITLLIIINQM